MKPLTLPHFKSWLETYGRASAENDPQASANLFAQDCLFLVEFDEADLCQTFREWWHIREYPAHSGSLHLSA
jgi:hypothetical protein